MFPGQGGTPINPVIVSTLETAPATSGASNLPAGTRLILTDAGEMPTTVSIGTNGRPNAIATGYTQAEAEVVLPGVTPGAPSNPTMPYIFGGATTPIPRNSIPVPFNPVKSPIPFTPQGQTGFTIPVRQIIGPKVPIVPSVAEEKKADIPQNTAAQRIDIRAVGAPKTMVEFAEKYNVTIAQIRQWNPTLGDFPANSSLTTAPIPFLKIYPNSAPEVTAHYLETVAGYQHWNFIQGNITLRYIDSEPLTQEQALEKARKALIAVAGRNRPEGVPNVYVPDGWGRSVEMVYSSDTPPETYQSWDVLIVKGEVGYPVGQIKGSSNDEMFKSFTKLRNANPDAFRGNPKVAIGPSDNPAYTLPEDDNNLFFYIPAREVNSTVNEIWEAYKGPYSIRAHVPAETAPAPVQPAAPRQNIAQQPVNAQPVVQEPAVVEAANVPAVTAATPTFTPPNDGVTRNFRWNIFLNARNGRKLGRIEGTNQQELTKALKKLLVDNNLITTSQPICIVPIGRVNNQPTSTLSVAANQSSTIIPTAMQNFLPYARPVRQPENNQTPQPTTQNIPAQPVFDLPPKLLTIANLSSDQIGAAVNELSDHEIYLLITEFKTAQLELNHDDPDLQKKISILSEIREQRSAIEAVARRNTETLQTIETSLDDLLNEADLIKEAPTYAVFKAAYTKYLSMKNELMRMINRNPQVFTEESPRAFYTDHILEIGRGLIKPTRS